LLSLYNQSKQAIESTCCNFVRRRNMRRLLFQPPPPSRTVAPLYYLVLVLLLPSIRHSQAQGQALCTESCVDACAQSSFADCQVTCNNTVADAVTTCQAAAFTNASTVQCFDGACQNVQVSKGSTVTCTGEGSCLNIQSNQSTIECLSNACDNAQFHASAVFCEPYYACGSAWYFECSCCDGYSSSCGTAPSCQDTSFCSNLYLGKTCKEWGNPVCADVPNVDETGVVVEICDGDSCVGSSLTGSILCDNKNNAAATATCSGAAFSNATAICDAGACPLAEFVDSEVTCFDTVGDRSCLDSEFFRTRANCYDNSCINAIFTASAVYLNPYSAGSGDTYFQACSCCDGYASNCAGETSCTADPIAFCSSSFLGRTCAEWGNPICAPYTIRE